MPVSQNEVGTIEMRLRSIEYNLPVDTAAAKQVSEGLFRLFSFSEGTRISGTSVEAVPWLSEPCLPTTKITLSDGKEPELLLEGTSLPRVPLNGEGHRASDFFGAIPVNITGVVTLLEGHILWIDHTGLNASTEHLDGSWETIVKSIGDSSILYPYPTGEPWFFIIPATKSEHEESIDNFVEGRLPRFELVELGRETCIAVQLDLQTDLSRQELEKALPSPLGISLPGLEDYFRSVFINHPWPGLEIRLDLRFGPGQADGEWASGRWLVQNSRRCNSQTPRLPRAGK